jgi:hypothetical protein
LSPPRPISPRIAAVLGFAFVLSIALLCHRTALFAPLAQQDEPVFVGAAIRAAAGGSPYLQDRYVYPPPLAKLGAWAVAVGGPDLFLGLVRALNVVATVALVVFAAGFAGLPPLRRYLLAALLVAALPIVAYGLWIGNPTSVAAALALAGWRIGERRPLGGAALVGMSLAFKPVALAGAVYLTIRWLAESRRSPGRVLEALAWLPAAGLCLAPWATELPALLYRMSEPAVLSLRNLSFRRIFDGFGIDVPAGAVTAVVLAVALLLARRRPVDALDRVHTAPVVALLALPLAWAHGFLFVLPLQVAAARLWWDRRELRSSGSDADLSSRWKLAERWGVPLALAAIQGSASAGVELAAPEAVRAVVILLPMLAPAALLFYLRRASRPSAPVAVSLDFRP